MSLFVKATEEDYYFFNLESGKNSSLSPVLITLCWRDPSKKCFVVKYGLNAIHGGYLWETSWSDTHYDTVIGLRVICSGRLSNSPRNSVRDWRSCEEVAKVWTVWRPGHKEGRLKTPGKNPKFSFFECFKGLHKIRICSPKYYVLFRAWITLCANLVRD